MISLVQKIGLGTLLVLTLFLLDGCSSRTGNPDDSEQRGAILFAMHCSPCHEAMNPQLKVQPPSLRGLFASKSLPSGAPATDEQVRRTIIGGRGIMPAFDQHLTKDDVNSIVKYLHTLS